MRVVTYEVGDIVRRSEPKLDEGTKQKLVRKWTGPWIIIKRLSDILYELKH